MRGNVNYQVQQLYAEVKAIGQSKHQAKLDARASGAKTTAEVAQKTGIHSYATADAYRQIWRAIGEFAKGEYGVKDMERLQGGHVAAFLESKITDGVSRATFDQYSAAASKLETALNRYANQNQTGTQYSFELKAVRLLGSQELGARNHEPRAYADPIKLLRHLDGQHQLVAKLQVESGARIKEVSLIVEKQLGGVHKDQITGQLRGRIIVDGKGGKERTLQVSPATYAELKAAVAGGDGAFRLEDYKNYLSDLKEAAMATGQDYSGSHGLRWDFAQNRMGELQVCGHTYEEALRQVSLEMGHERSDITEHYLK